MTQACLLHFLPPKWPNKMTQACLHHLNLGLLFCLTNSYADDVLPLIFLKAINVELKYVNITFHVVFNSAFTCMFITS